MSEEQIGSTALAVKLFDDPSRMQTVSRWRTGRQRPPLGMLPDIAEALGIDQLELVAELGIVDPIVESPARLAMRVLELESTLTREVAAASAATADASVTDLWRAVAVSRRWAMNVYPAVEGEQGYEVLVAVRLSFTSIDGADATYEQVEQDLGPQLRALGASRSNAPVFPVQQRAVRYSIREHTRSRPPRAAHAVGDVVSLMVLATTVRSWVSDVAAHLALPLGYGLIAAGDLAAAATNKAPNDTQAVERDLFAQSLIRDQPDRYVAYHHEATAIFGSHTLASVRRAARRGRRVIWVRESDALLDFAIEHRTGGPQKPKAEDRRRVIAFRDAMDDLASEFEASVVTVTLDLPPEFGPTSERDDYRPVAAARALDTAIEAFGKMIERGWLPDSMSSYANSPLLRKLQATRIRPSDARG